MMTIRPSATCLSLALCGCLAVPQGAAAQSAPPPPLDLTAAIKIVDQPAPRSVSPLAPSIPDIFQGLAADFSRLPSAETASLIGFGAVAAMVGHSVDGTVSGGLSRQATLGRTLEPGNIIGGYQMQLGGALATYTVGRLTGSARVSQVGADLLRAHIVSQVVTGAFKVSAKRTRPDGTHLSFPSGHTSASFATAAVLQRHFGWKVGVPAMGVAAYVAAARIQDKRHFLSDVAFGAAIGLAAGRTVTLGHGRGRFAVAPAAAPGGAGVALTWVGR